MLVAIPGIQYLGPVHKHPHRMFIDIIVDRVIGQHHLHVSDQLCCTRIARIANPFLNIRDDVWKQTWSQTQPPRELVPGTVRYKRQRIQYNQQVERPAGEQWVITIASHSSMTLSEFGSSMNDLLKSVCCLSAYKE
jgi:hypothetical protein